MILESLSSLATYYDVLGYLHSTVFLNELPFQVKLEGSDSSGLQPIDHVDMITRKGEAVRFIPQWFCLWY